MQSVKSMIFFAWPLRLGVLNFLLGAVMTYSSYQCRAQSITRTSAIAELENIKKYHLISNFSIGGKYDVGSTSLWEFGGKDGLTLESLGGHPLRIGYIAVGRAIRNDQDEITNAVIILPHYSGDASTMYYYWFKGQKGNSFADGPIVGPDCLIDTNKYYVIFLDALGLWGGSKPSDGLGMRFPNYSIFDLVQANYRLIKDELKIAKVKLAIGASMGAMQTYAWAILHPEFVEAILPIGGSSSMNKDLVTKWLYYQMNAAIKSDPVWISTKGDYYNLEKSNHPNMGVMFGWSILAQTGLTFDFRNQEGWEAMRKDVFSWNPEEIGENLKTKAADFDAIDLLYRNRLNIDYDVESYLSVIEARTLILHVESDQWLRLKNAEETSNRIKGSKIYSFSDPLAHYAIFKAPNIFKKQVQDFLLK